jgi:dTDP-4-dehydrorhamnose reductase
MATLLFGTTGMVGQALSAELARRGRGVIGVSRQPGRWALDLAAVHSLDRFIATAAPDLVVNAAAITALEACEADPGLAYRVNARAAALIGDACGKAGVPFVHVSTDHFFTGGGARKHGEEAPVTLVNEYARTKYAAECFLRRSPGALVVRTNVTGRRGWPGQPTFAEWAIDALMGRAPLRLFEDYFTSTIDAPSLARAVLDLADAGARGLFNVASRTVSSKRHFVRTLARALDVTLDWDEPASVAELPLRRAESLGLDVVKAETVLGRPLPDEEEACRNLVVEWKDERCATLLAS